LRGTRKKVAVVNRFGCFPDQIPSEEHRRIYSGRFRVAISGFHIVPPLDDNYIGRVLPDFKEIDPDYLMLGYCSADRFYDLARNELGDKVSRSAVGTWFVFEAS
jgi:metal-dependent hydrolase (beta-lactamase superfamily II)